MNKGNWIFIGAFTLTVIIFSVVLYFVVGNPKDLSPEVARLTQEKQALEASITAKDSAIASLKTKLLLLPQSVEKIKTIYREKTDSIISLSPDSQLLFTSEWLSQAGSH